MQNIMSPRTDLVVQPQILYMSVAHVYTAVHTRAIAVFCSTLGPSDGAKGGQRGRVPTGAKF